MIGGALFIGSFFIPAKKKTEPRRPRSHSLRAMFGLGLTSALIEVATALPYFAAIGLMTTAKLNAIQWVPVLAGYNFIMILPPLLLLGLYLLLGRHMRKPLKKLRVKIAQSTGSVLSWVMCIAGTYSGIEQH